MRSMSVALSLLISTAAFAGHRFSASAIGVSGSGAALASVALPPDGGEASAHAGPYDDGLVRFAEARSVVRGVKENGVAVTTTEVVLADFSIGGRIHADRVIVRTVGRQAPGAREPEIRLAGSAIENLTIDGRPVDATVDTVWFDAHPTFAAIVATGATPYAGGITWTGRQIRVDGLGVLTIGEVFVKDGARYIQMLRLDRATRGGRPGELRPDTEDPVLSVSGGGGGSNGVPVYP